MKKLFLSLALTAMVGGALLSSGSLNRHSGLTDVNISMLSATAEEVSLEVVGAGDNTGPRDERECGLTGTYHKMVCKCENTVACTDSDCF